MLTTLLAAFLCRCPLWEQTLTVLMPLLCRRREVAPLYLRAKWRTLCSLGALLWVDVSKVNVFLVLMDRNRV